MSPERRVPLTRTNAKLPAQGKCDSCAFSWVAENPTSEVTVEVYRAAKQHARDNPGHKTSATAGVIHYYVATSALDSPSTP